MPRFTPDFLDELRARLRASDVIGRTVKLKREGREFRGLSPFTAEKTPSFFVNDEKARYFDFSSGKSGDIIGFLMDTQSLSFVEAVSQLADLAGLDIPKDTPEDANRAERSKSLAEASLEAAKFFRTMLSRQDGGEAKGYLERRSVDERAQTVFGLGYAPASRNALKDHLVNKGFEIDILVEAGLLIQPDDGSTPYDRFRNRVMFPILGARGRVIAFGGRALEKTAKAKYLNSPETPLFHKSRTLYNLDRARRIANKQKRPIIVAEGYLDVIAIDQAGWPAVAPLGTALTELQLSMLWQSQDTPVLCFDGDRAGKAAAYRAIDRALPLLKPGKSLAFAFLGDGMDPDDLIRTEGAEAFDRLVNAPLPLADVVWDRHLEVHPRDTPEQQAAFRQSLRSLVGTIPDPDVRRSYGAFLAEKIAGMDGHAAVLEPAPPEHLAPPVEGPPRQSEPRRRPWDAPKLTPSSALKSRLGPADDSTDSVREAVITLTLIHHPELFDRHEALILDTILDDRRLARLFSATIDAISGGENLDTDGVRSHILKNSENRQTYDRWTAHTMVRLARFSRPEATLDDAARGWLNAVSIERHHGDLGEEVVEAAAEAHLDPGRERIWRDAISHRASMAAPDKSGDGGDSS